MRRISWIATAAATVAVVLGGARIISATGPQDDEGGTGRSCSEATLRGAYGIQIQGTRPAPGGLTESVIGIVLRNYDGQGSFSQVSNTYEVNSDCTGIVRFQPGPGILLEERLVIVDNGREIRTAVMVPTPVMITGVHQRIYAR